MKQAQDTVTAADISNFCAKGVDLKTAIRAEHAMRSPYSEDGRWMAEKIRAARLWVPKSERNW